MLALVATIVLTIFVPPFVPTAAVIDRSCRQLISVRLLRASRRGGLLLGGG